MKEMDLGECLQHLWQITNTLNALKIIHKLIFKGKYTTQIKKRQKIQKSISHERQCKSPINMWEKNARCFPIFIVLATKM